MTRGSSGGIKTVYFVDCNGNGIRDSIDIALGLVRDVNKNGRIDDCEAYRPGMRDRLLTLDDRAIGLLSMPQILFNKRDSVSVALALGPGPHAMSVTLLSSSGRMPLLRSRSADGETTIYVGRLPTAADCGNADGAPALVIEVDGDSLRTPLAWDFTRWRTPKQ